MHVHKLMEKFKLKESKFQASCMKLQQIVDPQLAVLFWHRYPSGSRLLADFSVTLTVII